jgi:hypothetical protein
MHIKKLCGRWPLVNFINILQATFLAICQKITKPNCNYIKAVQITFVQKVARIFLILMKLTPAVNFIYVLRAPFALIFFQPNFIQRKAVQSTFV